MKGFKDIPDELISSIQTPALIINSDKDVVTVEHALRLSRSIPNAQLIILPGVHGECIGECCSPTPQSKVPELVAGLILEFLAD